jgi:hypothetical protein
VQTRPPFRNLWRTHHPPSSGSSRWIHTRANGLPTLFHRQQKPRGRAHRHLVRRPRPPRRPPRPFEQWPLRLLRVFCCHSHNWAYHPNRITEWHRRTGVRAFRAPHATALPLPRARVGIQFHPRRPRTLGHRSSAATADSLFSSAIKEAEISSTGESTGHIGPTVLAPLAIGSI